MPSFNTFTKLTSLKSGLGNGSNRDKLRNLSGQLNSAASIIDDFITPPPGEGIGLSNSSVVSPNATVLTDGVYKFPEELGTTEYPSWVEITIFRRKTLNADFAAAYDKENENNKKARAEKKKNDNSQDNGFSLGGITSSDVGDALGSTYKGVLAGANTRRGRDTIEGTVSVPKIVICLPIQAGMGTDDKSVSVGSEELGAAGGAVLERGAAGALESLGSSDFLKGLGTATAFKLPGVGNALKIMTGSVQNPYSYQMFNGVEHRAFNLTFNVAPLSAIDSANFLTIKEILSYHMMPENNGFLLSVPDEFRIRYMHLVKQADGSFAPEENKFYPKSMGCYLQQVGYIPNDQGDVIHADGSPMTSQLQLQFTEIEVLDKKRLRDSNYYYEPAGRKPTGDNN